MTPFFDLSFEQLAQAVAAWGEPQYRAKQIWQAAYADLAAAPDAITTLPKPLRQKLAEAFTFASLTPATTLTASDRQTRKTLFRLADGGAIEAVLMNYGDGGGAAEAQPPVRERRTVCISTQAGCALGCVFCATGQMGFKRNLTPGEIVEQVLYYARALKLRSGAVPGGGDAHPLTNIVVMGMGEPFLNYENTLKAVDILNSPEGFNFGERRVTISTVGIVPGIERFTAEKRQINLAISLHAATDKLRSQLMPINRKYPLAALIPAVRRYVEATHRRVTFEWALIKGVNDMPEQAEKLADLAAGLSLAHVNLIPLNPSDGYSGAASTREHVAAFKAILDERNVPCTVRVRRGVEIAAGCGQLAGQAGQGAGSRKPAG
jgi:23S rRNA (adenine2503-C2)-methyltransferase